MTLLSLRRVFGFLVAYWASAVVVYLTLHSLELQVVLGIGFIVAELILIIKGVLNE